MIFYLLVSRDADADGTGWIDTRWIVESAIGHDAQEIVWLFQATVEDLRAKCR